MLAEYHNSLRYRKSKEHGNADAMSRLPLPTSSSNVIECPSDRRNTLCGPGQEHPCSAEDLPRTTHQDPILAQVIICLKSGNWPEPITSQHTPYYCRETELSVVNGLMMYGQHVIVPAKLCNRVKSNCLKEILAVNI